MKKIDPTDSRIVARLAGPPIFGGGLALTNRPPFSRSAQFVAQSFGDLDWFADTALWRRIKRLTPRTLGFGTSDKPLNSRTLLFTGMHPFSIRVTIDAQGAEPGVVPPVWSDVGWEDALRIWVYRRGPETERGDWYKLTEPAVTIRFWRKYYKRDWNEPIDWELGEHRTERLHRGVKNRIVLFYKVQMDFNLVRLPAILAIYTALDSRRLRINPYPEAARKEDFWFAGLGSAAVVLLRTNPSSEAERRYRQYLEYYRQERLGQPRRAMRIAEEEVQRVPYKSKLWDQWVGLLHSSYRSLGRYEDLLRFYERHFDEKTLQPEGKDLFEQLRRLASGEEPPSVASGRQILLHNLKHPEGPEGPYDHDRVVNRDVARQDVDKMKKKLLPQIPERWRAVIGARIEAELLDPEHPWWRNNKLYGEAQSRWHTRWNGLYSRLFDSKQQAAALAEIERLYLEGTGR